MNERVAQIMKRTPCIPDASLVVSHSVLRSWLVIPHGNTMPAVAAQNGLTPAPLH